jgi:hypothetical protein
MAPETDAVPELTLLGNPDTGYTLERGVYQVPWTGRDGRTSFVAVSRAGRRVAEAEAYISGENAALMELLWAVLDNLDPAPAPLHLVA